jgi:hypothetical protein
MVTARPAAPHLILIPCPAGVVLIISVGDPQNSARYLVPRASSLHCSNMRRIRGALLKVQRARLAGTARRPSSCRLFGPGRGPVESRWIQRSVPGGRAQNLSTVLECASGVGLPERAAPGPQGFPDRGCRRARWAAG